MSKMIQLRNVPDEIHRVLKARAAEAGMTLSGYLIREVSKVAERPTLEELFERSRRRGTFTVSEDPVTVIRKMREDEDRS